MELTLELRAALFVVFAATVMLLLYLQLKYFKKTRDEKIDAKLEREELYNGIQTARAICEALGNQGLAVGDAALTAERAMMAFERRDNAAAGELLSRARKQMHEAKRMADDVPFQIRPLPPEEAPEKLSDTSKLRLQVSFILSLARNSGGEGVESLAQEAEAALEVGDEEKALLLANRARRAAEGALEDQEEDRGCPECGRPVPEEFNFCGGCGRKVR